MTDKKRKDSVVVYFNFKDGKHIETRREKRRNVKKKKDTNWNKSK